MVVVLIFCLMVMARLLLIILELLVLSLIWRNRYIICWINVVLRPLLVLVLLLLDIWLLSLLQVNMLVILLIVLRILVRMFIQLILRIISILQSIAVIVCGILCLVRLCFYGHCSLLCIILRIEARRLFILYSQVLLF